jgi:hypothetical protein
MSFVEIQWNQWVEKFKKTVKYFVNYKNSDFNYSERDSIDDPKNIHYTYLSVFTKKPEEIYYCTDDYFKWHASRLIKTIFLLMLAIADIL